MKISLNWLSDYINIPCSHEQLGEILTSLGLEVEGIVTVESIQGGLKGVIVGHVSHCIKHPNADKLSLTRVNIGAEQELQIVCGAPNVAKGQKVLVATVGTTLYPSSGEPIKLKKGNIRGEASEGMICAEDELGMGNDHSGILVLPENTPIGLPASEYFQLSSDIVYEIGLTPNRSDATSHLGVAKDLAAYFAFHHGHDWPILEPNAQLQEVTQEEALSISIVVDDYNLIPRFSGAILSDIEMRDSPEWMQKRLKAIDVRPINSIVDITNYVLHEYGQPLHAYDYDQIMDKTIKAKQLPASSLFISLDERERKLTGEEIMICDGQDVGLCIGGVFGGLKSGVSANTKRIFLESAHFDAQSIRKTSMFHNLRTDAAKCFEKGADPNMTVKALRRAISLMAEHAGARLRSEILDDYPSPVVPRAIEVMRSKVSSLIGVDFSISQINALCKALSFEIKWSNEQQFTVYVPTNKTEVTRSADVIEEFLRIYGFDQISPDERFDFSVQQSGTQALDQFRDKIATFLAGKGLNQIMGLSLVPSKWYEGTPYEDKLVLINNTSNIHLDAMRPEMMSSGLVTVAHNHNRQQADLALFEFGSAYTQTSEKHSEREYLSLLLTGFQDGHSWIAPPVHHDYFSIKRLVQELLTKCGLTRYQAKEGTDGRFSTMMEYSRGEKILASLGKVHPAWARKMEIKKDVWYAEISVLELYQGLSKADIAIKEIPKYPMSRRDIAIVIEENVGFDELKRTIEKSAGQCLQEVGLFDIYRSVQQLGENKKSYAIQMNFVDLDKSMNDADLDRNVRKVVEALSREHQAELRKG